MRKYWLLLGSVIITGLVLSACVRKPYACTDPEGCVTVGNAGSIRVATLLTMSGPDSVYGIDAVRGVEIAIADRKQVFGHPVELVKADDLCTEEGGKAGAQELSKDATLAGVIGTTCSSASVPAAEIFSAAHMVLISPSSTAPSLTDPALHQPAFLRSIYNDKAQGKAVAEFAFSVLGTHRMITVHDGTAYPKQLQQAACDDFKQLGGECILQLDLSTGQDPVAVLRSFSAQDPDVIYFPLYTDDGVALMQALPAAGFSNPALISSDGLFSTDFIQKAGTGTEGMYLSGPAEVQESAAFTQKYKARYGEDPIASYHLQGYDAAMMLFSAIEKVAVPSSSGDNSISIPRTALREALYATHGMQGLSGPINCSPSGDCAAPNIDIFQVVDQTFKAIYP
ncbi:MAG: branched-chain amino acid ABC transporter substrate-binding protein [Anaerolineae bacterium]